MGQEIKLMRGHLSDVDNIINFSTNFVVKELAGTIFCRAQVNCKDIMLED
jgi:hypothetical protein